MKDQDGIPDEELDCDSRLCKKDNCKDKPNHDQQDEDKDGFGDICDDDVDDDGILTIKPKKGNYYLISLTGTLFLIFSRL